MNTNDPTVQNRRHEADLTPQEIARRASTAKLVGGSFLSRLQKPDTLIKASGPLILCVGGANIDYKLRLEGVLDLETSNPVRSTRSLGGVIRNVAANLVNLGANVALMTLLGDDFAGESLRVQSEARMDLRPTETIAGASTGSYIAVIDAVGSLVVGFADMSITDQMDQAWINRHEADIRSADWVVVDCNPERDVITRLIERCRAHGVRVGIVTISAPKMKHLPQNLEGVDVMITNLTESRAYFSDDASAEELALRWLGTGLKRVVITDGSQPITLADETGHFHSAVIPVPTDQVVDVTGAGDAFSSATLYGLMHDMDFAMAARFGAALAARTIQSHDSVRQDITREQLLEEIKA